MEMEEREVRDKTFFKIKIYGSQLDSDMWQQMRERSCKIFFYFFSQSLVGWDQNDKTPPKLGLFPDYHKVAYLKKIG